MTPSDVFDEINQRLETDASRAEGIEAVCNFNISGENGGEYHVVLEGGRGEAGPGSKENPNITVSMKENDFIALREGRLNGTSAFMTGKLKVKGDIGLAMKLATLLK